MIGSAKHDGKHALSRLVEFLVIKTSTGHIKHVKILFPGITDRGKLNFFIISTEVGFLET